ncbi:rRNA (guanine-N1-)-methyltransferase%2C 23S rRNA [Streptococcus pneumoniae]|nr:rRNA (guanine-N1-)-methyltransferase%2C 23S rRNA [Streptococcus pneumoniae]
MDILLDIFSPANYGEFRRVLSKDGILIKVIVGDFIINF